MDKYITEDIKKLAIAAGGNASYVFSAVQSKWYRIR
jgi:hypothetical protein